MRVAHLCRKPIAEANIAANVLSHGCGAVHIDAGRIACGTDHMRGVVKRRMSGMAEGDEREGAALGMFQPDASFVATDHPGGRWPANVILSHLASCEHLGTTRVPSTSVTNPDGIVRRGGVHAPAGGHQKPGRLQPCHGYADDDGLEEVAVWSCGEGCPVPDLDRQSGVSVSSGGRTYQNTNDMYTGGWSHKGTGVAADPGFGDAGGASRYYKAVKEDDVSDIPQDLRDYLYDLIAPTHLDDCQVIVSMDLEAEPWAMHEDESVHGAILLTPDGGDIPEDLQQQIWRVLKPGAHVLLVSPEDEPTGHTAACIMEDLGFEVRDAILWVREPGRLHYVPKPTQRERHAGCEHLKLQRREREEAANGLADELGDVGEVLTDRGEPSDDEEPGHDLDDRNIHKGNVHPTVKSKRLMALLLRDVPEGVTVLDPFMGSGSTGLACLETGHDFIGIEMESDYIEIADARVRHADRSRIGDGATIESEAPSTQKPREVLDLDDFFDL